MGAYEQRSFRFWWGAWVWALLGGIFIFSSLAYDRAVWLAFSVIEMWGAFRRSSDDTLSEFVQWIDGFAKPGTPWNRSWSALASGILAACVFHSGFVASFGYYGEEAGQFISVGGVNVLVYGPNVMLGVLTSTVVGCFLFWHFIHNEKHG